eukprot:m.252209 g.252209  ORF g.252209 m.252209 type:complete len:546 (-) comp19559_c1_seq1:211-1848(-)
MSDTSHIAVDAMEDFDDESADWDSWVEDGSGESAAEAVDLFSSSTFKSAQLALDHAKDHHSIDILKYASEHRLDQYDCIRLVNFIRKEVARGVMLNELPQSVESFASEEFFIPVLQDDALLQFDYESISLQNANIQDGGDNVSTELSNTENSSSMQREILQLRKELLSVKQAFLEYREMSEAALQLEGTSAAELRAETSEKNCSKSTSSASGEDDDIDVEVDDTDGYFRSYAHFGIHLTMLQDKVRTEGYRDAMYKNKDFFTGKTVLDVGCGTGILSMMAATAGAAKVFGVDNSSILHNAIGIITDNKLTDKISLIRGKIEEIELPVKKVDVIISEWMGYFLVFESMMDSVLVARDKWLRPGGAVYPDKCGMYVVALDDQPSHARRVQFWEDVYGFDMTSMKQHALWEADVVVIDNATVVSDPATLTVIDMMTATPNDIEFVAEFTLGAQRDCAVTGLCVYFDADFHKDLAVKTSFSTGPHVEPTHWRQTVFYFKDPQTLARGQNLKATMDAKRDKKNPRGWAITVTYKVEGADGPEITQKYSMA